jgi:two-component system, OmpR family, sensor histidine kinase BaeS
VKVGGIAARIAVAALAVAVVTLAIVAIGVMRIGADTFAGLMVAAGDSADHAREMFDHSIALVLIVAAIVAAAVAVGLAAFLARWIARPIERLAATAEATAAGDREAVVPVEGPDEVRSLAIAYNVMLDRLAEQEAIRREFVVNAAHELRTPLTNLRGYLEALRDGVIPPDTATFVSLGEEVDRLTRLAASLDDLAGGDVERPMPADVDLSAIVRSAVELAAPGFARRSIRVEQDIADGVVVSARPDEIAQVVANLLQNAMRYSHARGVVRIEVAHDGDTGDAVVRVTNTGPDIPGPDLPKVWGRFYRVEKSRDRATGGAGIGLAIVKRLVEESGGRVGAQSGQGMTTFWFSLPSIDQAR